MLALLGFCILLVLITAIMTDRMSPLIALILVPFAGALIGGFPPATVSKFVLDGLRSIIPAAGMFVFAILFFGIMSDAGMLDPIINRIFRLMGARPSRITMCTLLLVLIIHLDGSGAVTFMLAVPPLVPLYDRLGMDKRILACVAAMGAGVNVLPWVGPMIRSSAVLQIPATTIFNPLIPVQMAGLSLALLFAYLLGKKEEKRLGLTGAAEAGVPQQKEFTEAALALRRPRMFWPNICLAVLVITAMIMNWLDASVAFMLGTGIALLTNYPDVKMQKARVDAHAKTALMMASILMGAGVLVGIMKGTGMVKAMAMALVSVVPAGMEQHIPFVLGIIGTPLTIFFDPDSFYLGVLPVLSEAYQMMGGNPVQIYQAALLGANTVGFPISPMTPATFLLVGLCGIELGAHQRFSLPFLWACSILMTIIAALLGVIPW